jgi:hypothetical protein
MRVSQIQNLAWAGNALVLVGVAWVGLQFVQTWKASRGKQTVEYVWPKIQPVGQRNVHKPLAEFRSIWETPISGKVPPPPAPVEAARPKLDRWAEFQGKLTGVSGTEFIDQPERSVARIKYEGREISVKPGEDVGGSGFQLVQFTLEVRPDNARVLKLVFRHPETGDYVSKDLVSPMANPSVAASGDKAFQPAFGENIKPPLPEKAPLKATAYQEPKTREWIIPIEEQDWLEAHGDKILARVATKPDVDAQGVSHGVIIKSPIEVDTPLAANHGINIEDIIRSINGKPMTSKEDIVAYLRGEGKGLDRYEVVVEHQGKPRTVTYHVRRPVRRSPRD